MFPIAGYNRCGWDSPGRELPFLRTPFCRIWVVGFKGFWLWFRVHFVRRNPLTLNPIHKNKGQHGVQGMEGGELEDPGYGLRICGLRST